MLNFDLAYSVAPMVRDVKEKSVLSHPGIEVFDDLPFEGFEAAVEVVQLHAKRNP